MGVVSTTRITSSTKTKAQLKAREHGVALRETLEAALVAKDVQGTLKVKVSVSLAKRGAWRFGVSLPPGRATGESVNGCQGKVKAKIGLAMWDEWHVKAPPLVGKGCQQMWHTGSKTSAARNLWCKAAKGVPPPEEGRLC